MDIDDDSVAFAKANLIKNLVRTEIGNINDYNGFNVEFRKTEMINDSVTKENNLIFKFNSAE
jgi:hypothetical protein